ncbi:Regulatory protein TetR [Frankia canadensis]|uniref:Regulatory protein TetR n=1 Tax=Frankia canadensis TaxID=1836972 RepID=A0A2I2KMV5_9ACTN|nr:TetR/AcrR family transcriptional regulator [Frankia canadensis]SNQ46979.1 Regulatory protein TetR [Frankia canadensis]SOU54269.1 Regulatory protein TetR [Frankia canadensis]
MVDTRGRMVDATIEALRRHGVAGMSFTGILRDSGAARGAIYHHFPGGKAQLVAEAAERNGEQVRASLATLPVDDPRTLVTAFFAAIRPVLAASTTGGGCAIAAITVGAADDSGGDSGGEGLVRVAARIFASWGEVLAGLLVSAGLSPTEAADLATTLIMLLEGAHVLCRAAGTLEPFDRAARTAIALTL